MSEQKSIFAVCHGDSELYYNVAYPTQAEAEQAMSVGLHDETCGLFIVECVPLSRVKETEDQLSHMNGKYAEVSNDWHNLTTRVAAMEEALRFYADPANMESSDVRKPGICKIAKQALEGAGDGK